MTTIHTRQLQQYTQDNYNNTHKTTNNNTHKTTNNNTHKTTTTIHTRQLTTIHTRHLKIHVQKVNNPTVRQYCIQFLVFLSHTHCTHAFTPALHFSPLYYSYILFSQCLVFTPFLTKHLLPNFVLSAVPFSLIPYYSHVFEKPTS